MSIDYGELFPSGSGAAAPMQTNATPATGVTLIAVLARDWGVYSEQIDAGHDFSLVYGWVVGVLIGEDDEKLIIAHHWFARDGQVRHVTVVQKSCIIQREMFTVPAPKDEGV